MKKSMMLVFAVLVSASLAQAQDGLVDFDGANRGGGAGEIKLAAADLAVPAASRQVRYDYDDGDDGTVLNHFKKGTRCVNGNCESGYPGENCNIHTCGPKSFEKSAPRAQNGGETISLGDMLGGLDKAQQQRFYESLRFRDGALVDFYGKDIKSAYGPAGISGIIRYFLPASQEKGATRGCRPDDPNCTDDSYIDNARCNITHTCVGGFPGSTCTEAC